VKRNINWASRRKIQNNFCGRCLWVCGIPLAVSDIRVPRDVVPGGVACETGVGEEVQVDSMPPVVFDNRLGQCLHGPHMVSFPSVSPPILPCPVHGFALAAECRCRGALDRTFRRFFSFPVPLAVPECAAAEEPSSGVPGRTGPCHHFVSTQFLPCFVAYFGLSSEYL
jgi:hypothetical protein